MKNKKLTYEERLDASIFRIYGGNLYNDRIGHRHRIKCENFLNKFLQKPRRNNRCHICKTKFSSSIELAHHYKDNHDLYMCPWCHWTHKTKSEDIVLRHVVGRLCLHCLSDLEVNDDGICVLVN